MRRFGVNGKLNLTPLFQDMKRKTFLMVTKQEFFIISFLLELYRLKEQLVMEAGFPAGTDENDCNDETDECEPEWVEVQSKFDSGESSFSDFASDDNQLATCDEDDSNEVEIKRPPREEVYNALDVLKRFFMTSTNLSHRMAVLQSMERDVVYFE
ncbi:hypothetical protein PR048_008048 [Dryococelus australis]|uniref:Uncharacterized protein n=1 Tax=Dryococelus australis TaxID=614101 RepID=A0ABQ9HVZ4_9NEOP|nr:hypothetical protein PR048_008048 [Dryococelus australis]